MEIYLVRHTAVDIPPGTCYGSSDVPPAKSFEADAELVKMKITEISFDKVFTSPKTRCKTLCKYLGYRANTDKRLSEMDFGEWEMRRWDEITDPSLNVWYNEWIFNKAGGGESFFDLFLRFGEFMDELREKKFKRVLLITHGGILAAARVYFGNSDIKSALEIVPTYGEVAKYELDNYSDDKHSHQVVIVRHGESTWNAQNRLTGWSDVPLTEKGKLESEACGYYLRGRGLSFDKAYVSSLRRCYDSMEILLNSSGNSDVGINRDWKLNENHYGVLQGMTRDEAERFLGCSEGAKWYNFYDKRPPQIDRFDRRFPGNDPAYSGIDPENLPTGESFKDLNKRVIDFWEDSLVPSLRYNRKIIICAHGNSIREIIRHLSLSTNEALKDYLMSSARPLILDYNPETSKFSINPTSPVKL